MSCDNFRFNFTGDSNLQTIMELAFTQSRHAVAYAIREDKPKEGQHQGEWGSSPKSTRMVFYRTLPDARKSDIIPLPFKMDAKSATDFVINWLKEVDYGPEPDHDGSNGRGFNIYNESWGHVDGEWSAFVAVRPVWALYGK